MKRLFKFLKMIFTLAFIFIAIIAAYFTFQGYTMYKEAISECSIEEKVKEIKEANPDIDELLGTREPNNVAREEEEQE